MAFLIRSVSTTADGREIVRETRIDRDSIGVGRLAANELSLPDLSVEPNHARIERKDDRRISVTALGLGFGVDGRSAKRIDINAAKGAELAFGGHRITVSRNPEGDVVLAVRRVEALSDAEEERDEASAFSLRGKLPGKRATAWLLIAAVLIGFLAIPVWSFVSHRFGPEKTIYEAQAQKSWSSGPLSAAHHALEAKCETCHEQAFVSVRDTACLTCHKDTHDHAPPARIGKARAEPGAWGKFLNSVASTFNKPGPGACVDCHTEHEGAGLMAATSQAFCAECHTGLNQRLPDTKLGNAGDFGTSHPQFRPVVGGERVSLDAKPRDPTGLKFPHDLHLSRTGGVARMGQTLRGRYPFGDALECKDCHTPTADGTRFQPVEMERNCGMCHSLAFDRIGGTVRTLRHGDVAQMVADLRATWRGGTVSPPQGMIEGRRRPGNYAAGQTYYARFGPNRGSSAEGIVRQVFTGAGVCTECHTVIPPSDGRDWSVALVSQQSRFFQHGWFDHAAHKTESCASCHKADASGTANDLLLPGIGTCRTCHGGEASKAQVPSGCAMCHSYHVSDGAPWQPKRTAGRRN
jgi:predicted CXXCH cytochrome family protein